MYFPERPRLGFFRRPLPGTLISLCLLLPLLYNIFHGFGNMPAPGFPGLPASSQLFPSFPEKDVQNVPLHGGCPTSTLPRTLQYARNEHDVRQKKKSQQCTPTLDVLAWLMDLVNRHNETMMMAWGGLIHILREHDFVRENGTFIDDDVDTWVSTATYQLILDHEPDLWNKFGWTMRVFFNCQNFTVFGQLVAACGHKYKTIPGKAKQMFPTIELYPFQIIHNGTIVHDIWAQLSVPAQLLFPLIHLPFHSNGTNATLNLQMPHHTEKILTCIYGNWRIPALGYHGHDIRDKRMQCLHEAAQIL